MTNRAENLPVVLAIAGFDPSGGAGIITDVRTIESAGCRAVAAVTSITFQNQDEFLGAIHQSAESVRAQLQAVADEFEIAAVKIGMLPTAGVVREVASLIRELGLPAPVIDPVMKSTSGGTLMSEVAFEAFVAELLPLARVVTPNIVEAEKLAGMNITTEDQMRHAAARIRELGVPAVLIKGGHLFERPEVRGQGSNPGSSPTVREGLVEALDLLDEDGEVKIFRGAWIDAPPVRGTGCILSSAIAAGLAKSAQLDEAIKAAKQFVGQHIHAQTER